VRKVAAGDNFISPQLAEEVTFSGASINANPASQVTARELEILRLLGRGDKIAEVANALEISYKTVANTTSLLKQKLRAKSEPPRDCRRLFCLSHAATAVSATLA
jgi:DNA-binding NarL/FixJ family response regulator